MAVKETKENRVGKGKAGPGRPKGLPNKTTSKLKDAILLAAEKSGGDTKGKDGLVGYLKRVADEDVKAFSGLLGKVLPMQVTGEDGGPIRVAKVELVALEDGDS
ncbi:hypothetical protein [Devosia pacifica]|nr:hypothetical protein [Devosia pacifica]